MLDALFSITVGVIVSICFLAISLFVGLWLAERRRRSDAEARVMQLEVAIETAIDREQASARRVAEVEADQRTARRHLVPIGLPHHQPGPIYRN